MAPPTTDQVRDYIADLIETKTPGGEYALFEWNYLLNRTRLHFRSTTPAIELRMEMLRDNGDLSRASVSHAGYVRLTQELSAGLWTLYFRYHKTHQYSADNFGTVSAERTPSAENLWANGDRFLWTTPARFSEMVSHFTEVKKEHAEQKGKREEEKDLRYWELAEARDPDVRQLLDRLQAAVPGVLVDRYLAKPLREEEAERLTVTINVRSADQLSAMLAVLRKGLAS